MFEDPLRTIAIEHVTPEVDDGRFPAKREVGCDVRVEADIFKDGHDILDAALLYRKRGSSSWSESPMVHVDNDRWAGSFVLPSIGRFEYVVEAWLDEYSTWLHDLEKKHEAGDVLRSELLEGRRIIQATAARAPKHVYETITSWLATWDKMPSQTARVQAAAEKDFIALMRAYPNRSNASRYDRVLEIVSDPVLARFGTWYEMFPRSQGTDPNRGATFDDCIKRLPAIRAMGFDVVYVPPIHPIGKSNRKGKNNAVVAGSDDPGSPYAIGSDEGGHTDVEPSLGTLADFDRFVSACNALKMEVALDFAIQCSPDHPYVKEHPEWFFKRPDGTIKYAENPPKKYQDIYPLDFMNEHHESLWKEMFRVLEFWVQHGVKIFRVDNPHTKPLPFWNWLIGSLKDKYPELIFFAEAFTRPKMMKALGKVGFTQSYTYFTWRNHKQELTDYLNELTHSEMREYYRANFFTNTPDILPIFLQQGGRPAFKIRAVLAATMMPSYGIYSGFELCENRALPGREEYADSEKYQYKVWDWDRPGNIKRLIIALNQARHQNPALQLYDNIKFVGADHPDVIAYVKATPNRDNAFLVVVNLNPFETRETLVHAPPWDLGVGEHEPYIVHDIVTAQSYSWRGATNYVKLNPHVQPAHVFLIQRSS